MKKLKDLVPEMSNDVIYRCGWGGMPEDKNGGFLKNVNNYNDADEYLKKHKDAEVIQVNGECCPEGDGDWRKYYE